MLEHLIDDPSERDRLISEGRTVAGHRRVHYLVRTKQGRPIKSSGIYYCKHVLVDPETYDYIVKNKFENKEPLGSVVHRLLMQKKGSGLSDGDGLEDSLNPATWNFYWREYDKNQ